jgi:hypothetical protein
LTANVNNALNPLKSFTGQPLVTSTEMVLSNQFTHTPSLAKSAAALWEKLDLFEQNMFEERNFFSRLTTPCITLKGVPVVEFFLEWSD